MEIVTVEAFKSGDKIFLNKRDCEKYEKENEEINLKNDIIKFLVEDRFEHEIDGNQEFVRCFNGYCHQYEFLFVGSFFYVRSYTKEGYTFKDKPEDEIKLHLCSIEAFKIFYNDVLKIQFKDEQESS